MLFKKLLFVTLTATALSGLATSLKAEYYLDTLFPIGLTGLNNAGRPPFTNYFWYWTNEENPEKNEEDLIYDLGVNVIGCQEVYVNQTLRRRS